MGGRRFISPSEHTFFDAQAGTGVGNVLNVRDFRHVTIYIATDGGGDAALTVKCQGSISDVAPAWGSAATAAIRWEYVGMYDLNDAALTAGDTGFVVATADDYKMYTVNTDGLESLNFRVTARSAGEVSVFGKGFSG